MNVRVRYAPSPTGLQHIGGIRTALFNYFFARSQGGAFLLRVEDTDQKRFVPEAEQDLYDSLKWLGIEYDEGPDKGGPFGPYKQSERREIYQKYARQLLDSGHAYYCFCSEERLEELRKQQVAAKSKIIGYDRKCRDLSPEEIQGHLDKGDPYTIRFKMPITGKTVLNDILLGSITRRNCDASPDPVLVKQDGLPTYHLANVIDDHLMQISHIMRAQEWIPSAPLHLCLYEAFGWEPPQYCHLPMVMGKSGGKLSKRDGATSLRQFREAGYLPEAIINYVSMVGWSYDDKREFFTKEELCSLFTLEKMSKSPGVFDYKKLTSVNAHYMRELNPERLKVCVLPYLQRAQLVGSPLSEREQQIITCALPELQVRLRLLSDAPGLTRYLFKNPTYAPSEALSKEIDFGRARRVLEEWMQLLSSPEYPENGAGQEKEEALLAYAQKGPEKEASLLQVLRAGITGTKSSLPFHIILSLFPQTELTQRLDRLHSWLDLARSPQGEALALVENAHEAAKGCKDLYATLLQKREKKGLEAALSFIEQEEALEPVKATLKLTGAEPLSFLTLYEKIKAEAL